MGRRKGGKGVWGRGGGRVLMCCSSSSFRDGGGWGGGGGGEGREEGGGEGGEALDAFFSGGDSSLGVIDPGSLGGRGKGTDNQPRGRPGWAYVP